MKNELLSYYFGTLDLDQRAIIEDRLLDSSAYLMEYFLIKRELEMIPLPVEPSATLKERVAGDLFQTRAYRIRSLRRIVPAAAAAVAVVGLIGFFFTSKPQPNPQRPFSLTSIDSASNVSVSLNTL